MSHPVLAVTCSPHISPLGDVSHPLFDSDGHSPLRRLQSGTK